MPRNVKLHNLFDARNMKVLGPDNVTAGIPVLYRIAAGGGPVSIDTDIAITEKSRVVDAWIILQGAGTSGDGIVVKNGSTAITDSMTVAGAADKAVVGATTIDDAAYDIAAGGTLRVAYTSGGGASPPCDVYVLCHLVA